MSQLDEIRASLKRARALIPAFPESMVELRGEDLDYLLDALATAEQALACKQVRVEQLVLALDKVVQERNQAEQERQALYRELYEYRALYDSLEIWKEDLAKRYPHLEAQRKGA